MAEKACVGQYQGVAGGDTQADEAPPLAERCLTVPHRKNMILGPLLFLPILA